MFRLKANTPRWVIILIDLVLSFFSLTFAYLIRFDLKADRTLILTEWAVLSKSILIFFAVKFVVFYSLKIHKGLVRYTSAEDVRRILVALLVCSFTYFVLGIIRYWLFDGVFLFPSSVLIMEFLACFLLMIGSRFLLKLLYLESIKMSNKKEERILIYGAGISGIITKRTIEKDIRISYKLVGFIDDNQKMDGTRVEGTRVFHPNSLKSLIIEEGISIVIIAIQYPDEAYQQRIVDTCLELGVKIQKVPSAKKWVNGEFSAKQLAEINIEDLLGRQSIVLDEEKISNELEGEIILVSGAAGSIGSGMVRQIAHYSPKQIILLDQSESPLYDFQQELISTFPQLNFEVVIGDIRNSDRMHRLIDFFRPTFVFHAAAYKHVPLMESNPSEAVLTNIKGTKNLVDAALQFNVKKFVMISTDKAVNPTNVMGASKRIAEIYAQAANEKGNTKIVTTRFGNVLGSNGSVIPLFQKQIKQGGPVTVTDKNVTRFFMTITEACQLVLEAGTMGKGGEIFVFNMGKPVKIVDLAKKMIQLSGLEIGKDIEIAFTGLRPGEKLYEELLAQEENTIPTHHPQILKAKIRHESSEQLIAIQELICLFEKQENDEIVAKMKHIVPEYISNNSCFEKLDKK
jgi:FlaA1/EpsC-like NDP-sugar epimerase